MLKGGVIMDVMNVEQAKVAEEAGAVAVMALERIPSLIRSQGGIARMVSLWASVVRDRGGMMRLTLLFLLLLFVTFSLVSTITRPSSSPLPPNSKSTPDLHETGFFMDDERRSRWIFFRRDRFSVHLIYLYIDVCIDIDIDNDIDNDLVLTILIVTPNLIILVALAALGTSDRSDLFIRVESEYRYRSINLDPVVFFAIGSLHSIVAPIPATRQ